MSDLDLPAVDAPLDGDIRSRLLAQAQAAEEGRDILTDLPPDPVEPKRCVGQVLECGNCTLVSRKLSLEYPCMRCGKNEVRFRRCKGTALPGITQCTAHASKAKRLAGDRRERTRAVKSKIDKALAHFAETDPPPDGDDPIASIQYQHAQALRITHWLGQVLDAYADIVDDVGDRAGANRGIYELWTAERDRAAKLGEALVKADVAERQVRILEQQGHLIADAISAIIDSPELSLSPSQRMNARRLAGTAIRDIASAASG